MQTLRYRYETKPRLRALGPWLAGSTFMLQAAGCSLSVDTSTRQCRSNSECFAKGAAFANTMCLEGVCSTITTPACREVIPADALSHDNLVLLGFVSSEDSYGKPQLAGARFALEELNEQRGIGPDDRYLAVLSCYQNEPVEETTRHLTQKLRVPAIVGASYSGVTRRIFAEAVKSDVLVLSQGATSPTISDEIDRNLLWRTPPSDILQVEAIKLLYLKVEALLRSAKVIADGQRANLFIAYKGEAAGDALWGAAVSKNTQLTNAAERLEPMGSVRYKDPDGPPDQRPTEQDWDLLAQSIVDEEPHVIMSLGTGEFAEFVVQRIESKWPATRPFRPWYILPEGNRVDELKLRVSERDDLRDRIVGAAPGARTTDEWNEFNVTFQSQYQELPGNLAEYAYDAIYVMAYAVLLSNQRAPTGPQIADALARISRPPHEVRPGYTKFPAGRSRTLEQAALMGGVDYRGPSGPLDFKENGDADSDYALWCVGGAPAGSTAEFKTLKAYYAFREGSIKGDLDLSGKGWCDRPSAINPTTTDAGASLDSGAGLDAGASADAGAGDAALADR